ncbi:MAG: polymorphic toxin type 50 domain-containing protein [Treponemataceae bacterium]
MQRYKSTKNHFVEIIQDERLKGFVKNFETEDVMGESDLAKIHYSKTGHHIVPYVPKDKK